MKSEKRKQDFTRVEIIAAMAAVYRVEQEKGEELARDTRIAAHAGEAAEYSRLDEAYQRHSGQMAAMMKMVTALGIETTEFMAVVNSSGP